MALKHFVKVLEHNADGRTDETLKVHAERDLSIERLSFKVEQYNLCIFFLKLTKYKYLNQTLQRIKNR